MSTSDFIKNHIKNEVSTAKSKYVLFACHQNESDDEKLKDTFLHLGALLRKIHDFLIDNQVNTSKDELRLYIRDKTKPDTCYTHFTPSFIVGSSPFSFYSADGKDKGVMINLIQHNFTYCQKTLKKLAAELQKESYKRDEPISKTMALAKIKENVATGDVELPIVQNTAASSFYLDLENFRILAKTSHRDQDAISNMFTLLPKLVEYMKENGVPATPLDLLVEKSISERIYSTPFTNRKMSEMKSSGSYCLDRITEYYSKVEQDNTKKVLPAEPTWSCAFSSIEDSSRNVSFKDSLSLFVSDNPDLTMETSSFSILKQFSDSNDLNLNTVSLIGEIPNSDLLKELAAGYAEDGEVEENISPELTRDYAELGFSTYAKDGNICFNIKSGLDGHKEALSYLIRKEIQDTHFSQISLEKMILEKTGSLYQVLHDSINLFVSIYLESNQVDKNFQDKAISIDGALDAA